MKDQETAITHSKKDPHLGIAWLQRQRFLQISDGIL